MKTLLMICLTLISFSHSALAADGGKGVCVAAMIENGSPVSFAVTSACREVKSLGHGLCAAAMIRQGRYEALAVQSECRLVKSTDQGYCAAALLENGASPYSAVLGACSQL